MKYLSLFPTVLLSLALQAQTTATSSAAANGSAAAAGQTGTHEAQAAASAAGTTNVSAELTKRIDTKNAKVGDAVEARTTKAAKLADGTTLPRGTKLVGKVVDARARSSADKTSHLAFSLDQAIMHDGRQIPVHAVLTSLTGPASAATSADDDMAVSTPVGSAAAGSGATGGARSAGAGGMLGGVGRTAGGVVGGATNTVGTAGNTVRSTASSAVNETREVGGRVAGAASSSLDHVPVANIPGVTLSSSTSAESSGSLDATGKNISLENGTKMTLNVSAGTNQ